MTWGDALRARRGYLVLTVVVVVLDQVSKVAAHAWLRGQEPITIIPNFFNLTYSRNRGGVFGYFDTLDEPWRTALLTVFPLLAIAWIVTFVTRSDTLDRLSRLGLSLILGGAIGNVIDRVFRGEVVDFIDVYLTDSGAAAWLVERFGTSHWPTFNIADSGIVVGAGMLILSMFFPVSEDAPVDEGAPVGAADERAGR